MNLVKKTPVRFHWRLSTSLSYRGGETEGEIREEEEKEKREREQGLTLEGEKCSCLHLFLSFAHQFFSSGWCLLSKLISSSGL